MSHPQVRRAGIGGSEGTLSGYVVARVGKLHGWAKVAAAAKHNTRETAPDNADPTRKKLNDLRGHTNAEAILGDLRDQVAEVQKDSPKKIRKDAVLGLEYVFSFSPDNDLSEAQKAEYFQSCLNLVRRRHGDGQVLSSAIHRDETTDHLHVITSAVYVEGGRRGMSAKRYTDKASLKTLQDEVGEIGAPLGLQRGIEGSKAHHKEISKWYRDLKNASLENLQVPEKKLTESHQAYSERVLASVREQASKPLMALQKLVQTLQKRPNLEDYRHWQDRAKKAEKRVIEETGKIFDFIASSSPADLLAYQAQMIADREARAAIARGRGRKTADPSHDKGIDR